MSADTPECPLVCVACGYVLPSDEPVTPCPSCKSMRWRIMPPADTPQT